jgi:hypothetical protein
VNSESATHRPGIDASDSAAPMVRLHWQAYPSPAPTACYLVAGLRVCSDKTIAALAPFVAPRENLTRSRWPIAAFDCADDWQMVYQGTAWLGNRWRPLTCWSGSCGYRIHAVGMGYFAIDSQGQHVQRLEGETNVLPELTIELLLGPVLTLALALHGVWCLHASAVSLNGRTIAFLGDSGAGKSTLARFGAAQASADWRRLADDILPVRLATRGVTALPRFPQLKLPVHEQASQNYSQEIALDAVYLLEASPQATEIAWHPLNTKAATLALLSHTVAARLFDEPLLRRHLTFCAETAAALSVRRLVYPRGLDTLPAVLDALAQESLFDPTDEVAALSAAGSATTT